MFELAYIRLGDPPPIHDVDEARRWLEKAAAGNHVMALTLLANLLHADADDASHRRAAYLLRKAAQSNHPRATLALGTLYEHGHGVERDPFEAVHWHRKAAERGSTVAQFRLGLLYGQGTGVIRNFQTAAQWFEMAARQGHWEARVNLGLFHWRGNLGAVDLPRALMWVGLALETVPDDKKDEIVRLRDSLAAEMTAEQQAESTRLASEWSGQAA